MTDAEALAAGAAVAQAVLGGCVFDRVPADLPREVVDGLLLAARGGAVGWREAAAAQAFARGCFRLGGGARAVFVRHLIRIGAEGEA